MKKVKEPKEIKRISTRHSLSIRIKNSTTGITLIALAITIIVLLILAGVTIATLTGDNSILEQAGKAKEQTEIAREKEQIQLATIASMNLSGNNQIDTTLLGRELSNFNANIISEEDELYYIKYNDSNRYYQLNKDGTLELINNLTGEKKLTVQCINSNNEVLLEKIYKVLTDDYTKKLPNIYDYEAENETITGNITEDMTIQVLYYKIINDDSELVFTGLDSSGNVTTNETEIVSYMVGTNSSVNGNGLKDSLTIKSILEIPYCYNEKKVTVIGQRAFYSCSNFTGKLLIGGSIKKIGFGAFSATNFNTIEIGDTVETLERYAFERNKSLDYVKIGKGIKNAAWEIFKNCTALKKITYNSSNGCLFTR